MSRWSIASATVFPGYMPRNAEYAANITQEILIPTTDSRDYMLASEKALSTLWGTPEEERA